MANGKYERPREANPKIYRYNFKLGAEQNIRFIKCLPKPGVIKNLPQAVKNIYYYR